MQIRSLSVMHKMHRALGFKHGRLSRRFLCICTLMTIEDDLNRRNYGTSGFSETEQKRRYLVQVIENQVEEQDLQFRKASQKLEDEREKKEHKN